MDKYNLKFIDFESNVRDYFKNLREDQRLFDVTLATEDGQEIKAHKIVLSTGSDFFNDIFSRNNHSNMYIFLKGVSGSQLEQVIDFLYYGETSITQDEMKQFLDTAKLLKVKGLQQNMDGIDQNIQDEFEDNKNDYEEAYYASQNNIAEQETIDLLGDPVYDTFDREISGSNANKELDHQIMKTIEKTEDGKWKCNICGKIAKQKTQIKGHAETHIEGLSYTCDVCSKTCSTKQYLRQHISNNHTGGKDFSCKVCNKAGMNRSSYYKHNNMHHRK